MALTAANVGRNGLLPNIQEMYLEVKQYLAANATAPFPPPENLSPPPSAEMNTTTQTTLTETYKPLDTSETVDNGVLYAKHYGPKLVGVALTFQGLFGIYKSLQFIMVQFPELEEKLAQHIISPEAMNDIATKALIQVISTVLSMFFALKLTILQSEVAKKLSTVIGILLFIGNAFIYDYFSHIDPVEKIGQFFTAIFSIF